MINGWEVLEEARLREIEAKGRKNLPKGLLKPEWFKKHEVKGHVDTLKLRDASALQEVNN